MRGVNDSDALRNRLRTLVIAGNLLMFLWILYNGINEGFRATPIETASYLALMMLLLINAVVLFGKNL